ncbi:MAG: hypothetical protein RMY34_35425 [Aulosira sp. DedQUE10]|nr:hypothetical protein [Aulosira sp. DedQUE10]
MDILRSLIILTLKYNHLIQLPEELVQQERERADRLAQKLWDLGINQRIFRKLRSEYTLHQIVVDIASLILIFQDTSQNHCGCSCFYVINRL